MIEITKDIRREAMAFALDMTIDSGCPEDLYTSIMEKLYEIEREDDYNGTNELGRLLYGSQSKSIASIAKEHGLVPDVSHELSL